MTKYTFQLKKDKSTEDREIYDVVGTKLYIVFYPKSSSINVMKHGELYYRHDISDAFIMFLEQEKKVRKMSKWGYILAATYIAIAMLFYFILPEDVRYIGWMSITMVVILIALIISTKK